MDWERFALRLSAGGSLFMGALGIGFAWRTDSNAILLDGFFSLVGFVMALLTIRVWRLVRRRGDERFHFGYAAFSPLLNTVKSLTLLAVCGFALASAIGALLEGGRSLSPGWALVYAVIAATGCFAIALVQRHASGRVHSELLPIEITVWLVDGVMSLVVAAVFVVAMILQGSPWAHLVPYVDPVLVVLLVVLMIAVPLRTLRDNVGELLAVAPPEDVQQEVRRRFAEATRDEAFEQSILRMARIGRYFYVLVQIVVPKRFSARGISDLDRIRARIHEALSGVHPNLEIDTLFTAEKRWTE